MYHFDTKFGSRSTNIFEAIQGRREELQINHLNTQKHYVRAENYIDWVFVIRNLV